MSETNRKCAAVDQIVRNMTSDIHQNTNGQYVHLGFPPQAPAETWNMQNQLQQSSYITSFNIPTPEAQLPYQTVNGTHQPVSFNFSQQNQVFSDQYEKNINGNDLYSHFNMYQHNGLFPHPMSCYNNMNIPDSFIQNHDANRILHNSPVHGHQTPTLSPIIDNLVGNWTPNTSGTYSPFGNVPPSNTSNIFDNQDIDCFNHHDQKPTLQDYVIDRPHDDLHNFQFNRDTKKPRIIAQVKPMRPSYSDVLLKSVPPVNKSDKPEIKETKHKKDVKRNPKSDKSQKITNFLSRSNTNNEIKDLPMEKNNQFNKSFEKSMKEGKTQLNRKWVSLDNVTESFNDLKTECNETRKNKKNDDITVNKNSAKVNQRKSNKNNSEPIDTDSGSGKNDTFNINKSSIKKGVKVGPRQRNCDMFGSSDRPPGKRAQRFRKRENHVPLGIVGQKVKFYLRGWWKFCIGFVLWLFHLISDICSLSIHLIRDGISNLWTWFVTNWALFKETSDTILKRIPLFNWIQKKFKKGKEKEEKRPFLRTGLQNNINMPMTGDEAMRRLLACKGKDPYSILGLTPTCTDDDIKRYYKRQAVLVHPDKNKQPGAEEAFKILVHAFDMISEPDRRAGYDRGVAESAQVEQAWTELTELLAQFQQKVEAAAKTIRCSHCGSGHKRIKIDRPSYAARNCSMCKIHHAAREGDIWAEARCFGFLWHYYACMEGGVYDITEWAGCQKNSLKQLKPDSHNVQYRIALGKYTGTCKRHCSMPRPDGATNIENLLNRFYGQTDNFQNTKRRNKKFNK